MFSSGSVSEAAEEDCFQRAPVSSPGITITYQPTWKLDCPSRSEECESITASLGTHFFTDVKRGGTGKFCLELPHTQVTVAPLWFGQMRESKWEKAGIPRMKEKNTESQLFWSLDIFWQLLTITRFGWLLPISWLVNTRNDSLFSFVLRTQETKW